MVSGEGRFQVRETLCVQISLPLWETNEVGAIRDGNLDWHRSSSCVQVAKFGTTLRTTNT